MRKGDEASRRVAPMVPSREVSCSVPSLLVGACHWESADRTSLDTGPTVGRKKCRRRRDWGGPWRRLVDDVLTRRGGRRAPREVVLSGEDSASERSLNLFIDSSVGGGWDLRKGETTRSGGCGGLGCLLFLFWGCRRIASVYGRIMVLVQD